MAPGSRLALTIGLVAVGLVASAPVHADETDNFTCRTRVLIDALPVMDRLMSDRIQEALARANRPGGDPCDPACLAQHLQAVVGANDRHPLTGIPHAMLAREAGRHPDVDRCRLPFRTSIYGARPYHRPWLLPFTGRIIWLADSIRVSGRLVGLDKINHFLREGLGHWRAERSGADVAKIMIHELGRPDRRWRMTEYGLKGRALTGVLAYADLAASYGGLGFWRDLLSVDHADAFIGFETRTRRYVQRRPFTWAAYVNDAWDEAINCSAMQPALWKDVRPALDRLALRCPVIDCKVLSSLPDAGLYVNPACLAVEPRTAVGPVAYRRTTAAPIVQ
jgi:hypothetical protein